MYWLIPLFLSLLCAIINPYIGLFGIFILVELIIYFCIDINAHTRISMSQYGSGLNDNTYYKAINKAGKALLNIWCGLSIILFILCTVVFLGVWALASGGITGDVTEMAPFSIFADENKALYSVLLLIGAIILNLAATILVFVRKSNLLNAKGTVNMRQIPDEKAIDNINFHTDMYIWIALIGSILFGFLDFRFGWLSILLNMFYLFLVLVIKLIIFTNKKTFNSKLHMRNNASYFIDNLVKGKKYNNLMLMCVWLIFCIIVFVELLSNLFVEVNSFAIVKIEFGYLFLMLSCGFNFLTALFLSRTIRAIGTNGKEN